MNNVDRIARLVAKHGGENILIHTIPHTRNWIVGQKIEEDKWSMSLMDPEKNISFNLGIVSDEEHLSLWKELVEREVDLKNRNKSSSKRASELRIVVSNFLHQSTYKKFTKINKKKK